MSLPESDVSPSRSATLYPGTLAKADDVNEDISVLATGRASSDPVDASSDGRFLNFVRVCPSQRCSKKERRHFLSAHAAS